MWFELIMPPKKTRLVYRKYDKSKRSRTDEEDIVPELDVQINRPRIEDQEIIPELSVQFNRRNNVAQYSKKRRLDADK